MRFLLISSPRWLNRSSIRALWKNMAPMRKSSERVSLCRVPCWCWRVGWRFIVRAMKGLSFSCIISRPDKLVRCLWVVPREWKAAKLRRLPQNLPNCWCSLFKRWMSGWKNIGLGMSLWFLLIAIGLRMCSLYWIMWHLGAWMSAWNSIWWINGNLVVAQIYPSITKPSHRIWTRLVKWFLDC